MEDLQTKSGHALPRVAEVIPLDLPAEGLEQPPLRGPLLYKEALAVFKRDGQAYGDPRVVPVVLAKGDLLAA